MNFGDIPNILNLDGNEAVRANADGDGFETYQPLANGDPINFFQIVQGAGKLLGRTGAFTGPSQEIAVSAKLLLSGTTLDVAEANLTLNNIGGVLGIAKGGTGQTTASLAFNALAPAQTGNSGKFLTTNATNPSWDYPQKIGQLVSGSTSKSILFSGSGGNLAQDATNFTWDFTNRIFRLGYDSGNYANLRSNSNGDFQLMPTSGRFGVYKNNTNANGVIGSLSASNAYSPDNAFSAAEIEFRSGSAFWYSGQIVFKTNNSDSTAQPASEVARITAAGLFGIGTSSPSAKIHSFGTTEQLRLGYDANNYAAFTVDNTGVLNIFPANAKKVVIGTANVAQPGFVFETNYNATGIDNSFYTNSFNFFQGTPGANRNYSKNVVGSSFFISSGGTYQFYDASALSGYMLIRGSSNISSFGIANGYNTTALGGRIDSQGTGTINEIMTVTGYHLNQGNIITDAYAGYFEVANASGTITNAYGFKSYTHGGTNGFAVDAIAAYNSGLNIAVRANALGGTNNWAVYAEAGNNYFANNVSIGTTNALYKLTVNGSFQLGAAGQNGGFFGTSPIAKPTVSGSRGGNAALQSLLTALSNLGLITDSTT